MFVFNQFRTSRVLYLAFVGLFVFIAACNDPATSERPVQPKVNSASASALGEEPQLDQRFVSGLIGSKHDFSQSGHQPADLCLSCHSPHIAELSAPLLDRRPATTQPFRPYEALDVELDSASLLCLSCHDGVIASDVYSGGHAASLAHQLGSSQFGARTLSSHPIGVKYPLAEPKYRAISLVKSDGRIVLPEGRVQCISCHDPHNTARNRGMLVKSNAGSRLCLSCHRL